MRRRPLRNQGSPPRSRRFLTACDVAEIVQEYESGNTTQEIGARYGIAKTRRPRDAGHHDREAERNSRREGASNKTEPITPG